MALTAADILALVGQALYGPRWQTDLAGDLRVSDRTMRRWVASTETPRPSVLTDLTVLVKARQTALKQVEDVLAEAGHGVPQRVITQD